MRRALTQSRRQRAKRWPGAHVGPETHEGAGCMSIGAGGVYVENEGQLGSSLDDSDRTCDDPHQSNNFTLPHINDIITKFIYIFKGTCNGLPLKLM